MYKFFVEEELVAGQFLRCNIKLTKIELFELNLIGTFRTKGRSWEKTAVRGYSLIE